MASMQSIQNLEAELVKLKGQQQQLEATIRAEKAALLSPEESIAVQLHDLCCQHNHTDGCGWFYEISNGIHDWGGQTHKRWLHTARMFEGRIKEASISMSTADTVIHALTKTLKG